MKNTRVLYLCFTAYQFIEVVIHKLRFHKTDYSVLVVSNGFEKLVPVLERFVNDRYFQKVIYCNPNFGFNCEDSLKCSEEITKYYNDLFSENELNYDKFEKIYIAGAYRNFGVFATSENKKIAIFEDASGTLTQKNQYNYDIKNNDMMANLVNERGLYFGDNELIEEVYCVLNSQKSEILPEVKDKVHNFVIPEEFIQLDNEIAQEILNIYNVDKIEEDEINIIFTQWFIKDNIITKDEKIILHYQYLCDLFSSDRKTMIKIHPNDPMSYSGHFENCIISTAKYPSELLKCNNYKVEKVISINSTANNAFDKSESIKLESDPFGPIEIYNKLAVISELIKKFINHEIRCYGMSERFLNQFLDHYVHLKKNVEWRMPSQQPENSILLIDYLDWGKGTDKKDLCGIIKNMPNNSIYVFLNRQTESFWDVSMNNITDYSVPIVIRKTKIRDNTVNYDLNDEYIWVFSKNKEYREALKNIRYEKNLKQVGIHISVENLTQKSIDNILINAKLNAISNYLSKM